MCRFVAYTGKAIPLGKPIDGPDHSLVVQRYRPREMPSGAVNADGFGVGRYPGEVNAAPAVFTRPMPIWADADLPHLARAVPSATIAVVGLAPNARFIPVEA